MIFDPDRLESLRRTSQNAATTACTTDID